MYLLYKVKTNNKIVAVKKLEEKNGKFGNQHLWIVLAKIFVVWEIHWNKLLLYKYDCNDLCF